MLTADGRFLMQKTGRTKHLTATTIAGKTDRDKKETWVDVLTTMLDKANEQLDIAAKMSDGAEKYKKSYEIVKNINRLISQSNGITDAMDMNEDFVRRIKDELMHLNEVSEEATELRHEVYVGGMPYIKKYWDRDFVQKVAGGSVKVLDFLSNGFSILEIGVDVVNTCQSLSKVEANKAVFAENMQVIEWLGMITTDKNIKAATDDVMELLAENCTKVYAEAIAYDIGEVVLSAGIDLLAKKFVYVRIVLVIRDGLNILLGTKEDLEQMYQILCYSDMCDIYSLIVPMQADVSVNGGYYYCKAHQEHLFKKYLTNLAQLRILGEKECFAYLKGDGWLTEKLDDFLGTEDIERPISLRINMVRNNAKMLNLHLSDALKYELQ